ncbi:hypothetical protein [Brachybacterium sp. Marseille-Q7125]|uniref:lipopolysaccharide biosynthesis protein n=1 Tax=Brachybacterium sp. Marseille-Q7125 TaxID=2932815 RepID=UPI001FF25155|nr:hypothetical protein [Brachybacterium sp. Marseille-Q7125]
MLFRWLHVPLDVHSPAPSARHSALAMAGSIAQSVSRFVVNWLIGRLGGPSLLGQAASTIAFAQLLTLVGPTSIGVALTRELANARGQKDLELLEARAAHLSRRSWQVLPLLSVIALFAWRAGGNSWTTGLAAASLVMGYSLYNITRGKLYGLGRLRRSALWDLGTSVALILLVAVAIALFGARLEILFAVAAVYVLYSLMNTSGHRGVHAKTSGTDRFVIIDLVGTVASAGFLQVSILASRHWGGEIGSGHYSAAFSLALPVSLLVRSATQVLYPRLAVDSGASAGDRAAVHASAFATVMAAIIPLALGLIGLLGPQIVPVLWGDQYRAAVAPLQIIIVGLTLAGVATASVSLMTVTSARTQAVATALSIVGALIGAAVWLFAGESWGILGVAAGYSAGAGAIAIGCMIFAQVRLGALMGPTLVRALLQLGIFGGLCVWTSTADHAGTPVYASGLFTAISATLWMIPLRQLRGRHRLAPRDNQSETRPEAMN